MNTCVYVPAASVPLDGLPDEALAVHDTLDAAMRVVPAPENVLESGCTDTLNFLARAEPDRRGPGDLSGARRSAVLVLTSHVEADAGRHADGEVCCAHAGRAAEAKQEHEDALTEPSRQGHSLQALLHDDRLLFDGDLQIHARSRLAGFVQQYIDRSRGDNLKIATDPRGVNPHPVAARRQIVEAVRTAFIGHRCEFVFRQAKDDVRNPLVGSNWPLPFRSM